MKLDNFYEAKKTAIVSYGARITLFTEHIRSVELVYLREYCLNVLGREHVDYLSRVTSKEANLSYYKNISDYISDDKINEYDEIIIYNSPFNLFGGKFNYEMLDTIKALLNFKGHIYYFSGDPKFPCNNIAEQILARVKNTSGDVAHLPISDNSYYDISISELNRFSKEIWPKIIIAYAGLNYDVFCEVWNKQHRKITKTNDLCVNADWVMLDLFTYISVVELPDLKLKNYDKANVKYDLVYYGNNRHTERDKIIKRLYSETNTKNLMYGYKMNWPNCDYHDYVAHDVLYEHCCKNAWATIVLGDITHNNTLMSPRFFESLMIDLIAFIYIEYDKDKKFIENEELKDFIYFSTNDELEMKLNKIKNDQDYYKHIIELQRNEVNRIGNKFLPFVKNTIHKSTSNPLF